MKLKKFNEDINPFDEEDWDFEESTEADMIKRTLIKKYKQLPRYKGSAIRYSEKPLNAFLEQDITNLDKLYDVFETDDNGRYRRHIDYITAGSKLMARLVCTINENNPEIFWVGFYDAKLLNKENTLNDFRRKVEILNRNIEKIENPTKYK